MNDKQIAYVLAVADKGSFSKAAEELNVSQPSLSQFIRRIEKEYDITLFDRIGNDIRLTQAGKEYISAGRKILDMQRQMQNRFSDLRTFQTGSITVGIAPTRCQYLMPEIVKRFAAQYPGMHLEIEERFLANLLEDAEHGAYDLCVATLPVDENKFSYELMMQEEVVLAVPHTMPICETLSQSAKAEKSRLYPVIDIRAIASSDYVCLSDSQPTQRIVNSFCDSLGFCVNTAVRCMSIETQFSMVKSGIGLALIPSSLAKYANAENVDFFSVKQKIPMREMAVVYRKGQYLSEAMTALIQIMTSV